MRVSQAMPQQEPPRHVVYGSMRERIIPMIASAISRTTLSMEILAWDYVTVPTPTAILAGVCMAVRGFALTGDGRELAQFRSFSTWRPEQAEVDKLVEDMIGSLREARAAQVNGQ